jgi:mannose-6-phosphate isomerase-like protein (cupin superfamily)
VLTRASHSVVALYGSDRLAVPTISERASCPRRKHGNLKYPARGKHSLQLCVSIGVRFLLDGPDAGHRFAKHSREDEYSFVIEGRVGALLRDDVIEGGQGSSIFKPRDQWHTFWNAGDTPARILEIISPAGFEELFRGRLSLGGVTRMAPETLGELCGRYGLEMDVNSVPWLVERFRLRFPGHPLS